MIAISTTLKKNWQNIPPNKPRSKGGMKPEQAMNLKGKANTMHVTPGI